MYLDGSKYGTFISLHAKQKLKTKPTFGIFDMFIREGQLYGDIETKELV